MDREKAPYYVEKAEFPEEFLEFFRIYKIGQMFFEPPYGTGASTMEKMTATTEIARADASLATLLIVNCKLLGMTIELYGTKEHKEKYLRKIANMDLIGGWGLTEMNIGSDASGLETTVKKEGSHYILNGNKRWIGNANGVSQFF